tara:strand:+ start:10700 stop:11392 length:693 start_codon:yes stop_codon:yes gene_type:complete
MTPEQIRLLQQPLDPKVISERTQSGRKLSYIEGWHAIAEANRIFGHDMWARETTILVCVREPEEITSQKNVTTWRVGYMAKVKVTVYQDGFHEIVREGTGFGSGAAGDKGEAVESAIKEAETDAMKRAMMTFGNPFGLALYDKTKANVGTPEPEPQRQPEPEMNTAERNALRRGLIKTGEGHANVGLSALEHWWKSDLTAEERTLIGKDALGLLKSVSEQSTAPNREAAE